MSKINLMRVTVDTVFGETPLFVTKVFRGVDLIGGTYRFNDETSTPKMLGGDRLMQPTVNFKDRIGVDTRGIIGVIWTRTENENEAKTILADAMAEKTAELLSKIHATLSALKPVEHVTELWGQRHEEADMEFESFVFPAEVVGSSGWDYTVPGNEMTKTVFLEGPLGENSIAAKFVVTFGEGKADVITADGYINGEKIEQPGLGPTV